MLQGFDRAFAFTHQVSDFLYAQLLTKSIVDHRLLLFIEERDSPHKFLAVLGCGYVLDQGRRIQSCFGVIGQISMVAMALATVIIAQQVSGDAVEPG